MKETPKESKTKAKSLYFSHDADAHNDPAILMMIATWGFKGYGWFWRLLEQMRVQPDYRLRIDNEHAWNGIAFMLNERSTDVQRYINDCVDSFNLFQTDGVFLYSNQFIERMRGIESRINAAINAGKRSAEKRSISTTTNVGSTDVEQPINHININRNKNINKNITNNKKLKAEFVCDDEIIRQHDFWNNEEFQDAWNSYVKKRQEHKFTITARTAKSLLKELIDLSGGNLERAISIIDRAEAGNGKMPWRFFYQNDLTRNNNNNNANATGKKQPGGFINDAYKNAADAIR